jgi:hypothetical protein
MAPDIQVRGIERSVNSCVYHGSHLHVPFSLRQQDDSIDGSLFGCEVICRRRI